MIGPQVSARTTDATLDCTYVKNALVFIVTKNWESLVPLAPLHDPPVYYILFSRVL